MSTRIQKGGQKFKPVTKFRPRTEAPSRYGSSVPDSVSEHISSQSETAKSLSISTHSASNGTTPLAGQHLDYSIAGQSLEHSLAFNLTGNLETVPVDSSFHVPGILSTNSSVAMAGRYSFVANDSESISGIGASIRDSSRGRNPTIPAVGSARAIHMATPSVWPRMQYSVDEAPSAAQLSLSPLKPRPNKQAISRNGLASEALSVPATVAFASATGVEDNTIVLQQSRDITEPPSSQPLLATPTLVSPPTVAARVRSKVTRATEHPEPRPSGSSTHTEPGEVRPHARRSRTKSHGSDGNITSEGNARPVRKKLRRQSQSDRAALGHASTHQGEEVHGERPPTTNGRSASKSSHGRRSRAPSLPSFEPEINPVEELDPTVVTMAAICDDTGQGRVSSKAAEIQRNHSAWKAANREKRVRLRSLLEAKKYGRTDDEDGAPPSSNPAETPTESGSGEQPSLPGVGTGAGELRGLSEVGEDETGNGFNYSATLAPTQYSVQVRIGPNGETVVDEETLYVDRANDPEYANQEYTHIEESDQTKFVNSQSYSRKERGSRWSAEETELFFHALSQFGENYELISFVLPGRDRKSCKNKFKAEDKKNPNRITYCLDNRIPYDMLTLSRLTGKDFTGPTPEIRVPEIRRLDDEPVKANIQEQTEDSAVVGPSKRRPRKKSKTPGLPDTQVEVLGAVDDFVEADEDLTLSTNQASGQTTIQ